MSILEMEGLFHIIQNFILYKYEFIKNALIYHFSVVRAPFDHTDTIVNLKVSRKLTQMRVLLRKTNFK